MTQVPAQRKVESLKYKFLDPFIKLGSGFLNVQKSPNLEQLPKGLRESLIHDELIIWEKLIMHLPYYW